MTSNGGVQYVPQIAVQYVYLDFDGELTDYNGEILTIEGVEVRDSKLTQARIADILAELNKKYASQNVIFVTERPATAEYSTIFIGKTEAFDQYGNFAGLAETVDFNNQNRSDNAFVNLDSTATDEQIISTISHETDHLLGTLSHGGDGLQAYAATYNIKLDETLTGIELNHGDFMYISSGGTANDTTLNNGDMYISSGGTANTTINDGGGMYIFSGGTANTTINDGGVMRISSGGTANNTTMDGGWMYISSGGTANNTTINDGGDMDIESGGVANSTTVNVYGYMFISSGGVASSTTVNSKGFMCIYSGGVATAIRENGGYVLVTDGASVTFVSNTLTGVTLLSGDMMTVHQNTVANSTTVNDDGYMSISSGGVANSTTVNSRGSMYISSGGVANSTTVNSRGSMSISSGGVANDTTMNDGYMYIESGGVANSTTINSGGFMYIFSGVVANSTTINSGGFMYIFSGGVANSTTVNSDGYMSISSGGVANSTTVNSDGYMSISSGGTATAIRENGGYVYVEDGANVTFVSNTIEGLTLSGSMTVHQNTVASSTTIISGGDMYIESGGVANSTMVNDGGWMYIDPDGIANNVTLYGAGRIQISSGGTATIAFSPWERFIYSDAGATVEYLERDADIYIGHYSSGMIAKYDHLEDFTVSAGLSAIVYSGGVMNNTTVNDFGYMYISSGGVANCITVNTWCSLNIFSGGVANSTTLSGGDSYSDRAVMDVSSGGVANNTTVNDGGWMYIATEGVANNVTLYGVGRIEIASGGTATIAFSPWERFVYSDTGATVEYLERDANIYIGHYSSGMIAKYYHIENFTVTAGLSAIVYSGGVANSTTLSGGDSYSDFAVMCISSGGTANSTTVNSSGHMYIESGGIANRTTINSGGHMYIFSDGVANSTTVNSNGYMYIYSGGVANSTTVNSGGYMSISSGGVHRGSLQIESGTRVYAYGVIDFTLTGRSASSGYLINDLSRIFYSPTFTITVSDSQESGTYKLAQGAEDFTGSITIGTNGKNYGTLRVNGSALCCSTNAYRLTENNGDLQLTISRNAADLNISNYQVSNSGITTSESVKLTFTINNTGTQTAGASTLKVYDGDVLLRTVAVDSIAAGSRRNCTVTVTAGLLNIGTHKLYVVADANNVIAESDENNNRAYRTVSVEGIADLNISNYQVSNSGITTAESVKLTFTINNTGTQTAGASTLKIYDGDVLLRTVAVDSIAAGRSRDCTVTVTAGKLTAGTHKIYVVADANDVIAESDENNNRAYRTVNVTNIKADLRVPSFEVSKNSITTEESTQLTFTVYNDGNATAPGSTIKVYDGDTLLREIALGEIAAGAYRNCTITIPAGKLTAGTHKIYVVADANDAIAESDENNNRAYRTINVKNAPDLCVENYTVSDSSIKNNESVKLTFKITNKGGTDALSSTIKVYDGDTLLRTVSLDSIAAGSSRNCTITIPAGKLSEGTHKLYVVADANNVIAESDENNNRAYRTVNVTNIKADLRVPSFEVSKNNITTEESTQLTFKVYNDGDKLAPESMIKVYDGDKLLREIALGEIAAGAYRNCTITIPAGKLSIGTHKIYVVVDANNVIAESNENNNRAFRTIFVNQRYTDLTVSGSAINLVSGGTANVTNIYKGGNMTVASGCSAAGTTIHSAGKMSVVSGGTATETVINSSGTFTAGSGAIVNSLTLNRYGSMSLTGCRINKLTLNSRASATVTDLHIFGATINSSAHLSGCHASNSDKDMVLSGGVICSDGKITMSSGTVVSAVTVSKAGTLNVKNGGCARNIEIQREGKFIMLGTASNTTLFGGSMYVGDSAYENYDGTGGMPTSNVYDEDIHASKNTLQSSWLHIYSGGTATRNVVNSNSWLHVYYGGTATRNVVNSSGYLTVQDSGTANSATVHSGGYMRLYTGAILKGDINVGGKVTVHRAGTSATEDVIRAYGADINFLVNERRTTDSAIITDFGMIMGATYYLTVSDQAAGVYSLASGASDFTGSITVKKLTGGTMGTLRVNTQFASRGKTYRLLKESGTLKLRVTDNQSLADLAVSNYQVSSTSVSSEGSFKLTFTISNQGYANAGSSTIKVYDDTDTLLRTVSFDSLASGASRNCSITINALKLTPGARKIYVVADANDVVSEVNGLNNRAYRTVTINKAKADLVVQDFALSKNSITTSESVKLTFKVINKGGTDAPETMIKIYDGDKLLREVALGEIAAGGSRNCTVTITSGKLSVGTHKIYAKIDSDNVVPELYESNNTSYRTIFVKEPVRSLAAAPKENNSWDVSGTGSVDILCGGSYTDLGEWSLENSAALTRSAADILTTGNEESRLLNSGKLAG